MYIHVLLVLLALLATVNAFAPRSFARASLALNDAKAESKVAVKSAAVKTEASKATAPATKKINTKAVSSYTPVTKIIKEPAATKKFAEVIPPTPKTPPKPEESRQFKIEFPSIPLPKFESKVAVSPSASSVPSGPGSNDALVGISLGLVPFVLIPVALLNVAQGLIKKPKAIKEPASGKKVIKTFNKPLDVGAKEGIDELLSGKVTEDLELTRKGIKLSLAGFSSAAAGVAILFALGGSKPEAKVVEQKPVSAPVVKVAPAPVKAPEPVVAKPAPAPVKAPETVVAKPAPAPVKAPEPVVAKPAPAPVKAPEPVVAKPAPAPVKAPETVVAKPAPAPVKAPEPVVAKPAPAPVKAPEPVVEKAAPAPVKAPEPVVEKPKPAPAPAPKVEEYKAPVPKGMEPEKVDLEKLKSLRKTKKT